MIVEKSDVELLLQTEISTLRSLEPKIVDLKSVLSVCMFCCFCPLCGLKASAKAAQPILFKFSENPVL